MQNVGLRLPNDQLVSINAEAATRDLSLKKAPGSGRPAGPKVRVGIFAQLDCFLFADHTPVAASGSLRLVLQPSAAIQDPRLTTDALISVLPEVAARFMG